MQRVCSTVLTLTDITSKHKMVPCNPNIFLTGDIVQIEVSFIAYQLEKARYNKPTPFRLHTILRSIARMDTSVRDVSQPRNIRIIDLTYL